MQGEKKDPINFYRVVILFIAILFSFSFLFFLSEIICCESKRMKVCNNKLKGYFLIHCCVLHLIRLILIPWLKLSLRKINKGKTCENSPGVVQFIKSSSDFVISFSTLLFISWQWKEAFSFGMFFYSINLNAIVEFMDF